MITYHGVVASILACAVSATAVPAADTTHAQQTIVPYKLMVVTSQPQRNEVIEAGEAKALKVIVHNAGNRMVDVRKVLLTNCGCGGATIEPKQLVSGGNATVSYSPVTGGLTLGQYAVRLTVVTKDGEIVPVDGEASYTVERKVLVTPANIMLGTITAGEHFEGTLTAVVEGNDVPKDVKAVCSIPGTDISVSAKGDKSAKGEDPDSCRKHTFIVKVAGMTPLKTGEVRENVDVMLSDYKGENRVFRVPIIGRIPMDVESTPNPLMLGIVGPGQTLSRSITLTHKKDANLRVSSVQSPEWMSVSCSEGTEVDGRTPVNMAIVVGQPKRSGGADVIKLIGMIGQTPYVVELTAIYVVGPGVK